MSLSNITQNDVFGTLPIEITQRIGLFVESDKDLCNFRLISQATRAAIDEDNNSFWCIRYLDDFDRPSNIAQKSNRDIRDRYQVYKELLRNGAFFLKGDTDAERKCLIVLKRLVKASFSPNRHGEIPKTSRNIAQIKKFLRTNDLLQVICRPYDGMYKRTYAQRNGLLQAIQLVMAPYMFSLAPELANVHYGINESQRVAYSSNRMFTLLGGTTGLEVHFEYLLHNINFWQQHLCEKEMDTLRPAYSALKEHERIQWWDRPISADPKPGLVGSRWKTTFAYVCKHDVDCLRDHGSASTCSGSCVVVDSFAGEDDGGKIEELTFDHFRECDMEWRRGFENATPGFGIISRRPRTRAQRQAVGSSSANSSITDHMDSSGFCFETAWSEQYTTNTGTGLLVPLPPQHGIPGWQRLTMLRPYPDSDGSIDLDDLWAHEAIVLPGGKIALGRWWDPRSGLGDRMFSGPFIMWNVGPASDATMPGTSGI